MIYMKYSDYIEKEKRGLPEFPIQYYYVSPDFPRYIMNAHWHRDFEIIRVLEGRLAVFVNSVEYTLEKGDFLFVECSALHRADPEDCIYEVVVIDLNMLRRQQNDAAQKLLLPIINSEVGIFPKLKGEDAELKRMLESLFASLARAEKYYELEVYGLLFSAFFSLYTNGYIIPLSDLPHSRQAKTVTEILNWVEENFTEEITLEKLASLTGLSEKYICRIFKEYTSKTLVNYINELRVDNAAYAMISENKSVTQAAFDSGFNDLSYFCRIFKRFKGTTPKEFKKG